LNTESFASLGLRPALLTNLASLEYVAMTPIQARSLPPMLAGRDVIGQGKTGSGKTAAFGLGLLHTLTEKHYAVQALVLCPTRELADQVAKELRRLARGIDNVKILTLCGGTPIGPQIGSLAHGAHIIVGTPGRVEEHLRKETLKLANLRTLVLDEADRMMDMGFQPALDAILEYVPAQRQTLLFSATFPPGIAAIAKRVMQAPEHVQVESTHDSSTIAQIFHLVEDSERITALRLLLLEQRPDSAVVFCNTREDCAKVAAALSREGFSVAPLHGDLEQRERDHTLIQFANKSLSVLVATDVAARGLDIDALDAVINFHIPRDLDVYIHRIGRTGRAGSRGVACTLFSEQERHKLARLEGILDDTIYPAPLPPASLLKTPGYKPAMVTLQIDGGKKQKLRPGDILGALTGDGGIEGSAVGKITVQDRSAFVAVRRSMARDALHTLQQGKMKGRNFRARILGRQA
jgi:ATP-dependent RNA helicase DbpA